MRRALFLGAVGLAMGCKPALAEGQGPDLRGAALDEVVVTGSRAAPRAATETSAPVDFISGAVIREKGSYNLAVTLEALEPSVNFPRTATSFSASGTRSFSLRGLTPDQTLVLINGHRWHSSSVLVTNSTVGRGTVPVDLNTIPALGIQHVEILRDAASAQYGSDAIAGVVNLVLNNTDAGGYASTQYGVAERGDGRTWITNLTHGFKLGSDGHLTLTGEIRDAGPTNAAGVDPRVGRVTQHQGDPGQQDYDALADWSKPVGGGMEFYGDASVARRISRSNPLFRLPSVAPAIYPLGFLPDIKLRLWDAGMTIGLRGAVDAWNLDLSDTAGYNSADFSASNTINTSLLSPPGLVQTTFDSGGSRYTQNVVDLTATREFPAVLSGMNLALGLEHRYERYELVHGEPNSYAGSGAQGLPGYNPHTPAAGDRNAISVFADIEANLTQQLRLGLATRYENYSDFGGKVTGKASLFWRPSDIIAFRSSASTGFRAPSLAQKYFSSVTSAFDTVTHNLINIGTYGVSDPIARALGATPLKPETSVNYSSGFVLTPAQGLIITADAYYVTIDDRIILSDALTGPAVQAILHANGVFNADKAQFFTNAADTVTKGFEVTADYHRHIGPAAVDFTLGYGLFENKLSRLRPNPVLSQLPLLGSISKGILLSVQPRDKFTFAAYADMGPWRFSLDGARYGTLVTPDTGQVFSANTVVNASIGYEITRQVRLLAGVENIGDAYPDRVIPDVDGRDYSELSPIGSNGRQYFARMSVTF
jgi:iron complex outermembrane receptor protein